MSSCPCCGQPLPNEPTTAAHQLLNNAAIVNALKAGQVPVSAWTKEIDRAMDLAKAHNARDQIRYAVTVISNYWRNPIWPVTSSDRQDNNRTPIQPG